MLVYIKADSVVTFAESFENSYEVTIDDGKSVLLSAEQTEALAADLEAQGYVIAE